MEFDYNYIVNPDVAVEGEKDTELDQEKIEIIRDLKESNYTNEEIATHIGFTIDQVNQVEPRRRVVVNQEVLNIVVNSFII